MHKRTRTTVLIVAVILLLLAGAVYLRKKAPPEAARLLPESDGIVYVNLRPVRAATHFDQRPVNHDADYQRFIDATGIQFERDLDEAAFALHRMTPSNGPNGSVGFSTVFVGRFDGKRLAGYLSSSATSTEEYQGHTIYNIPVQGRTDRVTLLGYDIVALSNMPTTEQIHSILDRYRSAALPFAGSSLLSTHFPEVPLLSMAWGVGKIGMLLGPPTSSDGAPVIAGGRDSLTSSLNVLGFSIPVPANATFIASLRWTGSLHLRVEEIAADEATAAAAADSLTSLVTMFRTGIDASRDSATAKDVRTLLDSISVQHRKDRATLTATIPAGLLERLTDPPASSSQGTAP
ncbi:MAG TPA: hypothetical protein VGD59_00410 [Acidisarcina sp.]